MTVTYQILVLHTDRAEWLERIERAVPTHLRDMGLHASISVDVTEELLAGDAPSVAIVLLSHTSLADLHLSERIEATRNAGVLLIPIVDDLNTFLHQVPGDLAKHNGFEWAGDAPESRLAQLLFEQLGIEDRHRKVFLSHKRSDGRGAAEQLFDSLLRVRFTPFIDRYAIPVGEEVQQFIADSLEQYAFLLVLETPEAHLSEWVFDEVDYALAHTMGLLILQWPGTQNPIPGTIGVPRIELSADEITTDSHGYEVLTETALDRVLRDVELHHAFGLVRRRRMLITSTRERMEADGLRCEELKSWHLEVTGRGDGAIIAVAPRLPVVEDLQFLDETRNSLNPTANAVLVHSSRRISAQRKQHLDWAIGDRRLRLLPESDVGTI